MPTFYPSQDPSTRKSRQNFLLLIRRKNDAGATPKSARRFQHPTRLLNSRRSHPENHDLYFSTAARIFVLPTRRKRFHRSLANAFSNFSVRSVSGTFAETIATSLADSNIRSIARTFAEAVAKAVTN